MKVPTEQKASSLTNRLIFFDNLRGLIIVFVTFFHSSMNYTLLDSFWRKVIPLDVFLMLILFFIAGYFALPSLQKKGIKQFLTCKLKRLGLPLIVGILFVLPILDYLHYRHTVTFSGTPSSGISEYWISCVTKIGEFNMGLLNIHEQFYMPDQFYQHYLWFLSLLIVFFVVLSGFYFLKKEWVYNPSNTSEHSRVFGKSFQKVFFISGLLLSGYYYAIIQFVPSEATFFTMGNIIQLQPARLGLYFGGFLLGIFAFTKNWFKNDEAPTTVFKAGSTTIILLVGTILIGKLYFESLIPSSEIQLSFALMYNFLCLSTLLLLITTAKKYWNTPSKTHQKLTLNSYNIYLFHYAPIIIIQLLLSSITTIPAVIKSVIVFSITLIICFGLSQYIVRPMLRKLKDIHQNIRTAFVPSKSVTVR
ncbi:MAG: acyltransferase family protein [Candidatus Bathyarchaeota archaeon]|nr:MAG: acyltransferase family protein [Candidatus Bathyarchaeota archaeon]